METKLAGHCGVDSGQIMVIDPCYAFNDNYTGNDDAATGGNYDAICRISIADTFGEFPLPANGYTGNVGVGGSGSGAGGNGGNGLAVIQYTSAPTGKVTRVHGTSLAWS